MDIRIRDAEGTAAQPFLLWDTVWPQNNDLSQQFADWQLAGPNAPLNAYGLAANQALNTAFLLCLFTWRRAESYDNLPSGTDPKGWWGDTVDIEDGEDILGSRLWLLFRSPLTPATAALATDYTNEALQPLITQGAVASFANSAVCDPVAGTLVISVNAYSQNGALIYSQKFTKLWQQEFR
jgi:phage gp46-like protein